MTSLRQLMPLVLAASLSVGAAKAATLDLIAPIVISFAEDTDFFVIPLSKSGSVTAAVGNLVGATTGCTASDWAGFAVGNIALLELDSCGLTVQIANAAAAGATAVLLYDYMAGDSVGNLTIADLIPAMLVTSTVSFYLLELDSAIVGMTVLPEDIVPAPVPLPASAWLMVTGLLALAFARRRRMHSTVACPRVL